MLTTKLRRWQCLLNADLLLVLPKATEQPPQVTVLPDSPTGLTQEKTKEGDYCLKQQLSGLSALLHAFRPRVVLTLYIRAETEGSLPPPRPPGIFDSG